jgi:predicted ATPase/class 3 adenylate cyclase
MGLPTGTVTFWMTDIEGSTRLLQALGPQYADVLADHHAIVRAALGAGGGVEVDTEGDGFFCVFRSARGAVEAAARAQRDLASHPWPGDRPVRVRLGVHTGEGQLSSTGYVGLDVHRTARVTAAAHGGQVVVTATTRALLEGAWPAGVGYVFLGSHRLKDLDSPELLYQLVIDGLPSRFPPLRSLEAPSYDLPFTQSSFVGRSREADDLARLLDQHRLVTLTGPGGVGKTRLAVRTGAELSAHFPGGVAFVPLAAVHDAALVPDEVARALALPVGTYSGDAGLRRLTEQLSGRRMLLVLDNVEQLLPGAAQIGALVDVLSDVTVLATSRAPLHLREEQEYPVRPLDVPADPCEPLPALLQHAAVQQFLDRARAARPDFELRPEDAPHLARIVSAVGGLPLAVELVAARVRSLSLAQIAQRLGDQLGLLRGGPRDLPKRQRALRDTLQWSYDLLDAAPRALLEVLAAFPGGATLEALEGATADLLPCADVLDALDPLIEHGLLMPSVDDTNRYRTLQVVREFAAEMLQRSGRADEVWHRHAAWLEDVVTAAAPMLLTDEQAEGLHRLREEYDNLRAVLEWAIDAHPVLAADLAGPLWRYWQMRGQLAEGRRVLDRILDRLAPEEAPASRAAVLSARGGVSYWQLDIPAMTASYEEAARLYERLGDEAQLAEALYNLAFPSVESRAYAEGERLARRSEELFAELGDAHGVARTLWLRSLPAIHAGRLDEAEDLLRRAAATFRATADTYHLGWALRMLGRDLILQGRLEEARKALDEGLGNFARDDVSAMLLFMSDHAALAGVEGDPERQLRIVGAMQRMQRATGTDLVDYALNEPLGLDASLAALGDRAELVRAEGAAMDDDEAIRYAVGG